MGAESLSVLVLAGGRLRERLPGPAPLQHSNPLLLPAGSQLALHTTTRFYLRSPLVEEVVVAIDATTLVPPWLRLDPRVKLLPIEPQEHILGSVAACLPALRSSWVQLNPITTRPSRPPELSCSVEIADESWPQEDWACLSPSATGNWCFHPKAEPSPSEGYALTGILCARKTDLHSAIEGLHEQAGDDLIHLAAALHRRHHAQPIHTPWLDLGHRASFWASRQHQLPSRSFNQVSYCPQAEAIRKRSSDHARLSTEGSYLEELPPTLQPLFPQLLQNNSDQGELLLEWIPYPNLAELLLHWQLGRSNWKRIAHRLRSVHERMGASAPLTHGHAAPLYSHKLRSRWQAVVAKPQQLEVWMDADLRVNGVAMPALPALVNELLQRLEPLEASATLGRIHGDLCFNNILCEPLSAAIRLIDPRGEALPGLPRGHGDRRYDLAKLHHSLVGGYDACVNGLFRVDLRDHTLDLQLYHPADQIWIEDVFAQEVFAPLDRSSLNTLSASLFLSMLPLHSDDPERQLALAAIGALLMQDARPAL